MGTFVYAAKSALLIVGLVWFVRPWMRARRLGAPVPVGRVFSWRIGGMPPDLVVDAYLTERAAGREVAWIVLQETWLANRDIITDATELARFVRERVQLSTPRARRRLMRCTLGVVLGLVASSARRMAEFAAVGNRAGRRVPPCSC